MQDLTVIQKMILDSKKTIDLDYKLNLLEQIHLMREMSDASKLIRSHMESSSLIILLTDYDCDGITSAVVLYKMFKDKLNYDNIKVVINSREFGNGINGGLCDVLDDIHKKTPIGLVITADHGSSSRTGIKRIKEYSDIIVTDHHEIPDDNWPEDANVFINNQSENCKLNKGLSGCAVAFITMCKVYYDINKDISTDTFYDIIAFVALTTISDVMPLDVPINREFCKIGIRKMTKRDDLFWLILTRLLGITRRVNAKDIGFNIAPLINSCSRMGRTDVAFKALTLTEPKKVLQYIKEMSKLNIERKSLQKSFMSESLLELKSNKFEYSNVIYVDTDISINGIISGNIGELSNRPTVTFKNETDEDMLSGSCRAIRDEVHLLNVFKDIESKDKDLLVGYGGHKMAAGCKIKRKDLDKFRIAFDDSVKATTVYKNNKSVQNYDLLLPCEELTHGLCMDISRLEPFGNQWQPPKFKSTLKIKTVYGVSNFAFITFLTKSGREISGFWNIKSDSINGNNLKNKLRKGDTVDVIHTPELANVNRVIKLKLNIINIEV